MNSFNLIQNPWIPVLYANGDHTLVSLETAFKEAEQIADLDCLPHERISLMRLLVCITQTVYKPPATYYDWDGYADDMETGIPQYLQQRDIYPHFNLFGDGPRFLQVPLQDTSSPVKVSKLISHLATGNNTTLFDQESNDKVPRTFSPAVLAKALVTFQNFYPLYGAGHKGKGGPCVVSNMLHTLAIGASLRQTLIKNCLTQEVIEDSSPYGCGTPLWELSSDNDDFETIATLSYLGRLVPRHRDIHLSEDGTQFYLSKKAIQYPEFEIFREPSATVTIAEKQGKKSRYLLSAKLDKAIWRDLHLITVVKNNTIEEAYAPLCLQSHAVDAAEEPTLWVGALVTKQAKIIDVVESSLTVPPTMFLEDGRTIYQKGLEYAERISKQLYTAVKQYGKELKHDNPPVEAAKRHYWNALDREVRTLLDLVRHPESRKDSFGEGNDPWTQAVRSSAIAAYEFACPRQTPRQLKAYAEGLRTLYPKIQPKPKKHYEQRARNLSK